MKREGIEIKEPFTDFEYLELSLNKKIVYTYSGDEINGKTKKDIQEMIGREYGTDTFFANAKIKGRTQNIVFPIKGIKIGAVEMKANNTISFDDYKKLQDENFSLKEQLRDKEIQTLREEIKELKNNTQTTSPIESILMTLLLKNNPELLESLGQAGQAAGTGLNDKPDNDINYGNSDQNEKKVPKVLFDILAEIDYSKISAKEIQSYADSLKMFTSTLPKIKKG